MRTMVLCFWDTAFQLECTHSHVPTVLARQVRARGGYVLSRALVRLAGVGTSPSGCWASA